MQWESWREARGQALAEAAMILPMLLILLWGIFVVGRWFIASFVVTAAAREGARLAALTGDCAELHSAVSRTVQMIDRAAVAEQRLAIAAGPTDYLPGRGEDLTVTVVYVMPDGWSGRDRYADLNASSSFPFGQAVGRATARLEVAPLRPNQPCVFPE